MTDAPLSPPEHCDIAIVGAGLAGSLIALALADKRPDLRVALIDADHRAGGNHVWSFFDSDVSEEGRALLSPLISRRWESGYDVRFPGHSRRLSAGYNSISSDRLHEVLEQRVGNLLLGSAVEVLDDDHILLKNGNKIIAKAVIDARGFAPKKCDEPSGTIDGSEHYQACDPAAYLPDGGYNAIDPVSPDAGSFFGQNPLPPDLDPSHFGWQKFVGRTLRLAAPHGLDRPVIMDATVEQIDGYRFVYLLPWDEQRIFVEDTYYSDDAALDTAAIRGRIADYAAGQGWQVEAVEHEETGVLPVAKGGAFESFWPQGGGIARAGMRAGLFHATTGYSLPMATELAVAIAGQPDLSGDALARWSHDRAQAHWRGQGYYRMLSRMLFDAAQPDARYRIFERFYHLPEPLIERFYAGRSTIADKFRILCGRPPVPIRAAMHALIGKQ